MIEINIFAILGQIGLMCFLFNFRNMVLDIRRLKQLSLDDEAVQEDAVTSAK